jgi:hypothetical protein
MQIDFNKLRFSQGSPLQTAKLIEGANSARERDVPRVLEWSHQVNPRIDVLQTARLNQMAQVTPQPQKNNAFQMKNENLLIVDAAREPHKAFSERKDAAAKFLPQMHRSNQSPNQTRAKQQKQICLLKCLFELAASA